MEEVIGDKWRALSIILIGSSAPWSPAHSGPSGAVSEIKFSVSRLFSFLFLFHSFIFLLFFRLASFVFFLMFLDTSPKAIKILNISFYLHFYSCILYFFSLLSSLFSVPDIRKEPPNIKFKNELKMKDVPYVSGPRSK